MKIEHIIRDYMVENPDFIEEGLKVVEKEHYLPDEIGTSGFIDILCSDIYNNFVIVEIGPTLRPGRLLQKSLNTLNSSRTGTMPAIVKSGLSLFLPIGMKSFKHFPVYVLILLFLSKVFRLILMNKQKYPNTKRK
ncbi:endonuclease NucS domain-containing protein [Fluviicola sp.]|uniref:endonuclease NucS domain-containing protein n=1 Tax=Fluviicola sp. TaxID=1917219 RepID=UPI0031DB42C4